MEKKDDLSNPHIIISGGSKGLGLALCQILLAKGYNISTFSRSATPEIESLQQEFKNSLHYETLDIRSSEALAQFIQTATLKFKNTYGLINNAAVVQEGVLATLPEIEIENMIAINLTGALCLTRLFLRHMLFAKKGRIINISSIIGQRGYRGLSVYSATKAALEGMTRSLARELGSRYITVNAVAPGYLKSEMSSTLSDEHKEQIQRRTPLGRLGHFDDVVPAVCFLLSEEASFITGQSLLIDGGISN